VVPDFRAFDDAELKAPLVALATDLHNEFAELAPAYATEPAKAVYRIYRDVRFSKDKTPYKTNASMYFASSKTGKDRGAGFYLHVSPTEVVIAGGMYMVMGPDLLVVRRAIESSFAEWQKIVKAKAIQNLGGVEGDALTRPPKGFDPDSPAIEWLKKKQFLVATQPDLAVAESKELFKVAKATFKAILPMNEFLNQALLEAGPRPESLRM